MKPAIVIRGIVIKGQQRGKKLGFPTANFILDKHIAEGIYVSRSILDGQTFESVTFIGAAKTYGENDVKAETYIFDFAQDIYGKVLQVSLLKKLRGNKKFASGEELIKQIEIDIKQTQDYFLTHKR